MLIHGTVLYLIKPNDTGIFLNSCKLDYNCSVLYINDCLEEKELRCTLVHFVSRKGSSGIGEQRMAG